MDDQWMKIGYALMLGLMVIFLFPRAKHILKNTRKAETGEWQGFLIPIAVVILFVLFLIQMVR
ncbi:MAG: hypothetical protein ACE5EH_10565 [Gammaproteobacteria bacterium]